MSKDAAEALRTIVDFYAELTDAWDKAIVDDNFTIVNQVKEAISIDECDYSTVDFLEQTFPLLVNAKCDWKEMKDEGVPPQRIVSCLWLAVEGGLKKDSTVAAIRAAALAASCYLAMCSIKAAKTFKVFNEYLAEKCVNLLRMTVRFRRFGKRSADVSLAAPSRGRGRGRGRGGWAPAAAVDQSIADNSRDGGADEEAVPSQKDLDELMEKACEAVYLLFSSGPLSAYSILVGIVVDLLREYVREEDNVKGALPRPVISIQELRSLDSVVDKVFAMLHVIAETRHGRGGLPVYERFIYPRLALWTFDCTVPPKIQMAAMEWKEICLAFVRQRVEAPATDDELATLRMLIQNLVVRCTDRSEYRATLAKTIALLIRMLPRKLVEDVLQDVYTLSLGSRLSTRGVCAELVPILLQSIDLPDRDVEVKQENLAEGEEEEEHEKTTNLSRKREKKKNRKRKEVDDSDESGSRLEESEDETEGEKQRREKKSRKGAKNQREVPRVDIKPGLYFLVARACFDKTAHIRASGVQSLVTLLLEDKHREELIKATQKAFITYPKMFRGEKEENAVDGVEQVDISEEDSVLPADNVALHIITTLMEDENVAVRKKAVAALAVFFPLIEKKTEADEAIKSIKNRFLDESLSIRKQAVDSLTLLLKSADEGSCRFRDELESEWLQSVLKLINDRETSVQTLAAHHIEDILIKRAVAKNTPDECWKMLRKVEGEAGLRRLLLRVLNFASGLTDRRLKVDSIYDLQDKLQHLPQWRTEIWMLLSDISTLFKASFDPRTAFDTWMALLPGEASNVVRYVAKVLGQNADRLSSSQRRDLILDVQEKLFTFEIGVQHISEVYLLLSVLMDGVGEQATGSDDLESFGRHLLDKCSEIINEEFNKQHKDEEPTCIIGEQRLVRVISSIGEVIQHSAGLISRAKKLFSALKTVLASGLIQAKMNEHINSAMPSRPITSLSEPLTGNSVDGTQQSNSQGTQKSVLPDHVREAIVSGTQMEKLFTPTVRAIAVLAIGKFCLLDETAARECVPAFVCQLRVNKDHFVRNNIVIVLCDLCIRYTQLVDRYTPIIAACLKDPSTLVRYQAVESITNLVKESFIRWEGQIMYRFVSLVLDESFVIRSYSSFCLLHVLLPLMNDKEDLFFKHFIECLLYLNDVSIKHHQDMSTERANAAGVRFTLSGAGNHPSRMTIYKFMLTTFDDRHKFVLMSKIAVEVLSQITCEELRMEEERTQNLLKDSFTILSCEEIRLRYDVGRKEGGDEDEDGADEAPEAIKASAREGITTAFREAIISNVMPHLLDLRKIFQQQPRLCASHYSLLLGVFAMIIRDHEEQIDLFLAGDRQLKREIVHEIKLLKEREIRRKEREKKRAALGRLAQRSNRRSQPAQQQPQPAAAAEASPVSSPLPPLRGETAEPERIEVTVSEAGPEGAAEERKPSTAELGLVLMDVDPPGTTASALEPAPGSHGSAPTSSVSSDLSGEREAEMEVKSEPIEESHFSVVNGERSSGRGSSGQRSAARTRSGRKSQEDATGEDVLMDHVRPDGAEKSVGRSTGPTGEECNDENAPNTGGEAVAVVKEEPLDSIHEEQSAAGGSGILEECRSNRRRSSGGRNNFVAPTLPAPKKRTRAASMAETSMFESLDETRAGPLVSTPNKDNAPALSLDVSAILPSPPSRGGRSRRAL